MCENELSSNVDLSLDELDAVAGGAGGADAVELEGQVTEHLGNGMFQVRLDDGNDVRCHLSGRLRMNFIRVVPGDRVYVQLNPDNPSSGRIIWRQKG